MRYSMMLISFLFSIVSTSCHAQDNLKSQEVHSQDKLNQQDISDVFPQKVEKSDVDKFHSQMAEFEKSVPQIQMIHTIHSNDWNAEQGTDIPSGTLIHAKILVGNEISLRNGTSEPLLLEAESVVLLGKEIALHNCRIIAIPKKEILQNRLNAETDRIICVDKDGPLFESSIQGYIADTDNISGIKGNIINLNEGINSLSKELQKSIKNITHASKNQKSNEIAQWYLDQMEATLPIIKINSGIDINVITTKEIVLKNI